MGISTTIIATHKMSETSKFKTTSINTCLVPTLWNRKEFPALMTIRATTGRDLCNIRTCVCCSACNCTTRIDGTVNTTIILDHFEPPIFAINELSKSLRNHQIFFHKGSHFFDFIRSLRVFLDVPKGNVINLQAVTLIEFFLGGMILIMIKEQPLKLLARVRVEVLILLDRNTCDITKSLVVPFGNEDFVRDLWYFHTQHRVQNSVSLAKC